MYGLDTRRAPAQLRRVDRGDAAREHGAVGPDELDAVARVKGAVGASHADGEQARTVLDDGRPRTGVHVNRPGDPLAMTQPELERGRPIGCREARPTRAA